MTTRRQLIGQSSAIRDIEQEVQYACQSDAKVLITGESGVGKEVVASLIHQRSRRHLSPFVAINCAGLPDSLLESELFGHVRGSFTDAHRDHKGWIEQASNGTIFLDEVGEMSLRMQAVLLRFLETGEIQRVGASGVTVIANVRVIAATNRSLLTQIAHKHFREDLYYRLNVIHISIPPLRDRREDIDPLLDYFIRTTSQTHNLPMPTLMEETRARLRRYSWPGNVRELKNVAERLVVRSQGGEVPPSDLPSEIVSQHTASAPVRSAAIGNVSMALYDRIVGQGESFWSAVYEPFMVRDLTRDDLRALITHGLIQTKGSYKLLLELFNLPSTDYKRFLAFLRKHQCHMPFQKFRSASAPVAAEPPVSSPADREERFAAAR